MRISDDQIIAVTVPISIIAVCAVLLLAFGPPIKLPCKYSRQVSQTVHVEYWTYCEVR